MVATTKLRRNSAIELLRIVAMLIIIADHFGVHGLFHFIDCAVHKIVLNNIYSYQILFTKFVDWVDIRQLYFHFNHRLFYDKPTSVSTVLASGNVIVRFNKHHCMHIF